MGTRIRALTQVTENSKPVFFQEESPSDGMTAATQLSTNEITITTTGNIDDLDFGNANSIRMNNASLSTLRGLKAGSPGQKVTILSIGAGQVDLAHQNTGSAAGNRFINVATSASSSLSAGVGSANYIYDATTARWRLVEHIQGAFITTAFNAANFVANGAMTWTVSAGNIGLCQYYLVGRLLHVIINITGTTVGGTPNTALQILVAAIGGFAPTTAFTINASGRTSDNGAASVISTILITPTLIDFFNGMSAGLNWTLSTANTATQGEFFVEVG